MPSKAVPPKRRQQEAQLDEALEDSFPASDPVTVGNETGDEEAASRKDRKAPLLDVQLIEKLARGLKRETKEPKGD
jgi:hypothetical protein